MLAGEVMGGVELEVVGKIANVMVYCPAARENKKGTVVRKRAAMNPGLKLKTKLSFSLAHPRIKAGKNGVRRSHTNARKHPRTKKSSTLGV